MKTVCDNIALLLVSDRMDIFLNQLNNATNFQYLLHTVSKAAPQQRDRIVTTGNCDVTLPYVYYMIFVVKTRHRQWWRYV